MIRELKILRHHGIQYVPDLKKVEVTALFRGRPVISKDITGEEAAMLENLCPSGAIKKDNFSIDLGRCVFCKECQFACPEKIRFTNDYKIASNDREGLIIRSGDAGAGLKDSMVRREVRKLF